MTPDMPRCEISVPWVNPTADTFRAAQAAAPAGLRRCCSRSAGTGQRRRAPDHDGLDRRRSTCGASARRVTSTSGNSGIAIAAIRERRPSDNVGFIPLAALLSRHALCPCSFASHIASIAALRLLALLAATMILGCASQPAPAPAPTPPAASTARLRRRRRLRRGGGAAGCRQAATTSIPEVPITGASAVSVDGGGTRSPAG